MASHSPFSVAHPAKSTTEASPTYAESFGLRKALAAAFPWFAIEFDPLVSLFIGGGNHVAQ